jgi:hypothetical protein
LGILRPAMRDAAGVRSDSEAADFREAWRLNVVGDVSEESDGAKFGAISCGEDEFLLGGSERYEILDVEVGADRI